MEKTGLENADIQPVRRLRLIPPCPDGLSNMKVPILLIPNDRT